jgi:hypothetical protein
MKMKGNENEMKLCIKKNFKKGLGHGTSEVKPIL